MSCGTCHVILPEQLYNKLGLPSVEEQEMLDAQDDYEDTSRLGCQVKVTQDMDGVEIRVSKSCWVKPAFTAPSKAGEAS